MYPDDVASTCKKCYPTCMSCFGPGSDQCLSCNSSSGMIKPNEASSKCVSLICPPGKYLKIAETTLSCDSCHTSCSACIGPKSTDCIDCPKMRHRKNDEASNETTGKITFSCKTCSEINSGLYTLPNGNCQGIMLCFI